MWVAPVCLPAGPWGCQGHPRKLECSGPRSLGSVSGPLGGMTQGGVGRLAFGDLLLKFPANLCVCQLKAQSWTMEHGPGSLSPVLESRVPQGPGFRASLGRCCCSRLLFRTVALALNPGGHPSGPQQPLEAPQPAYYSVSSASPAPALLQASPWATRPGGAGVLRWELDFRW